MCFFKVSGRKSFMRKKYIYMPVHDLEKLKRKAAHIYCAVEAFPSILCFLSLCAVYSVYIYSISAIVDNFVIKFNDPATASRPCPFFFFFSSSSSSSFFSFRIRLFPSFASLFLSPSLFSFFSIYTYIQAAQRSGERVLCVSPLEFVCIFVCGDI